MMILAVKHSRRRSRVTGHGDLVIAVNRSGDQMNAGARNAVAKSEPELPSFVPLDASAREVCGLTAHCYSLFTYWLSYRDVEELLSERGLSVGILR